MPSPRRSEERSATRPRPGPGLRTALRRLVGVLALLGGTAFGTAQAAELVLAVAKSALSLPVHVAEAQGYFAAEGVAVRTLECVGGQRCIQQLFDRTAQMATASELPVMFNSFERSDFAVVATFVTSHENIRLVARKSAGITGPAQLAGKRIGVIARSSSQYYLEAYLLFHGLDPRQVKTVPLAPDRLVAALAERQVDAFVGYSQQTWPARKALGADAVLLDDPRIYTESFNLVVDRRTLAEREGEVVKVLRALERAQRFIAEQPDRAKKIIMARVQLDEAYVNTVFDGYVYRLSLEQSLISTMELQARWALREGHVPAGLAMPNYLNFVDGQPLRKVLRAATAAKQ